MSNHVHTISFPWGFRPVRGLLNGVFRSSLQTVTWVCDPMHGNTETVSNFKTRRYENIRAEVWALWRHPLLAAVCCVQAHV